MLAISTPVMASKYQAIFGASPSYGERNVGYLQIPSLIHQPLYEKYMNQYGISNFVVKVITIHKTLKHVNK